MTPSQHPNGLGEEARKEAEIQRNIGASAFLDNTQKSLNAYRRATQLDPSNADGWNQLGLLLQRIGELDEAINAYQTVLRLGEEHQDQEEIAVAYGNLGSVYQTRGDLDKAAEYYNKALEIDESLGHKEGMASDYGNLSEMYRIHGDLDKAVEYYNKALEINESLGRKEGVAANYGNLGSMYQMSGDSDKALEYYNKSLKISEILGSKEKMAAVYGNLGNVYLTRGDFNKAVEYFNKALEINASLERNEGMAIQYGNLGSLHQTRGDLDKAVAYYNKAFQIFNSIGHKEGISFVATNLNRIKRDKFITEIEIKNYKSVKDLKLNVGRINFLIGENGCGKSNILEAITFASSAEANKLDNEFLASRGIRITEPKLMRSAFDEEYIDKDIEIKLTLRSPENVNGNKVIYLLRNENKPYSKWHNVNSSTEMSSVTDFIIYSPENSSLRNLEKEGQIQPLGIYGEGLFKLLSVTQAEQPEAFAEIVNALELFGWYESIAIPSDDSTLSRKITLQDRYLTLPFDQRSANEGFLLVLFYITLIVSKYTPKIFAIDNIDTSLNPKFCTKLMTELVRLAKKYDKQIFVTSHNPAILDGVDLGDDKQRLIVVSRNDEDGHTECQTLSQQNIPKSSTKARLLKLFKGEDEILKRIEEKFNNSEEPIKLSEAFLRGYLGGLSTGF